jgi:hypothetical protein
MAKKTVRVKKKTLGLSDVIDIPDAELFEIPCKIDTGAYNCSIDCSKFRLTKVHGEAVLFFTLLGKEYNHFSGKEMQTTKFIQKKVKSSSGHSQYRYQVILNIKLFDEIVPATFNLSRRHNMKYPILLGRKLLARKYLVDVSKRNLSLKAKSK